MLNDYYVVGDTTYIQMGSKNFTLIDTTDLSIVDVLGDRKWSSYIYSVPHSKATTMNAMCSLCDPLPKMMVLDRLILPIDEDYQLIQHINGDTLDNRRCNLIAIDKPSNIDDIPYYYNKGQNYIGVTYHKVKKLWYANLYIGGKTTLIGKYRSPLRASVFRAIEFVKAFGPNICIKQATLSKYIMLDEERPNCLSVKYGNIEWEYYYLSIEDYNANI